MCFFSVQEETANDHKDYMKVETKHEIWYHLYKHFTLITLLVCAFTGLFIQLCVILIYIYIVCKFVGTKFIYYLVLSNWFFPACAYCTPVLWYIKCYPPFWLLYGCTLRENSSIWNLQPHKKQPINNLRKFNVGNVIKTSFNTEKPTPNNNFPIDDIEYSWGSLFQNLKINFKVYKISCFNLQSLWTQTSGIIQQRFCLESSALLLVQNMIKRISLTNVDIFFWKPWLFFFLTKLYFSLKFF